MLTDSDFTHVICGYSTANSIKNAFNLVPASIVKCGDMISVGQQNLECHYSRWEKARVPALEATLDADLEYLVEREESFRLFHNFKSLDADGPILIWVDYSVSCQLMTAYFCYVFKQNGWDLDRLHSVAYPRTDILWMGLLEVLDETKLRQLRPDFQKLKLKEIQLYSRIWETFAGAELSALISLLADDEMSQFTMDALPYLRRRLPSRINGLNEIDVDVLKHAIAHAPSAIRAVAHALGHDQTPDMVGDLYLFARLKHLGSPDLKHPLIEIDNPTGNMRDCKIRILPIAHKILAGRANMIALNGLDDWLGGVHLTPDNVVYREDLATMGGSK